MSRSINWNAKKQDQALQLLNSDELLGGYNGASRLRSVQKSLLERCRDYMPDVDPHYLGKIATFAVHLMLNATKQFQQYRLGTGEGATFGEASDDWIAGRLVSTDSDKGKQLVLKLLDAIAHGEVVLPDSSKPIRVAAKNARSNFPSAE